MTQAARLVVTVEANIGQLERALSKTQAQLIATRNVADKQTTAMARGSKKSQGAMAGMAASTKVLAGAAGIGGLAMVMTAAVRKGAAFEKQMASTRAVSGGTAREMGKLRKQAMDIGPAFGYGATEAAKAQTELAKGGLSVATIFGGAFKSAITLAAAGELSMADAATYTVNAMKTFGIQGRNSAQVADALAVAANKTTADVSDFGMALTQGGAAAKAAGLSFRDTMTVLGALAEIGVKSSDAGTSMKAAFLQLLNPTKRQAEAAKEAGLNFLTQNGEMKNAIQISSMLREKTEGMTRAQRTALFSTLAGTDGLRTLLALYDQGPTKLSRLEAAFGKEGAAVDTARDKQRGMHGDLKRLSAEWESAQITFATGIAPGLADGVSDLGDALRKMRDSGDLEQMGTDIGSIVSTIGEGAPLAAAAVGQLADTLQSLSGSLQGAGDIAGPITSVISQLSALRDIPVLGDVLNQAFQIDATIALGPIAAIKAALGSIDDEAEAVGSGLSQALTSGMSAAADQVMGLASTMLDALSDVVEIGNKLSPGKFADIDTSTIRDAQKQIDEARERAREPIPLKFKVESGGQADRNIREMVSQLDKLGKKQVAIKIASNAPTAVAAMAALSAAVQGVPTSWITRLQNNAKSEQVQVTALAAAIAGVPRSKISRIVTNSSSEAGAVRALQAAINSLTGKNVTNTVTTIHRTIGRPGNAPSAGGSRPTATGKRPGSTAYRALVGEGMAGEWVGDSSGAMSWIDRPTFMDLGRDSFVIPTEARYRRNAERIAADLGMPAFAGGKSPKKVSGRNPFNNKIEKHTPAEWKRIRDRFAQRREAKKRKPRLEQTDPTTRPGNLVGSTPLNPMLPAQNLFDQVMPPEVKVPQFTAGDVALAQAKAFGDLGQIRGAAGNVLGERTAAYQAAVQSGDTDRIKEAADALKSAGDELQEAGRAIVQSSLDSFDAQLIRAKIMTPKDLGDDLAALQGALGVAMQAYNDAFAAGDIRGQREYGSEVLNLTSSIDELKRSVDDSAERTREMNELLRAQLDEVRRDKATSGAAKDAIIAALTDASNRKLGGVLGTRLSSMGSTGRVAVTP
ncbi:MAG: phage tail tape measure protein [Baekduiaceae bacterium]